MSDVVITSVEQATPEWLTTTLSASGAITSGMVVDVDVDAGHGNCSNNARLLPRSSVDASGDCPTSLFLKMVNIDLDDDEHFGNSEVAYYTRDYVDVPDAPLVRCHHAAYSKARDGYHLLLDDIGATHIEATGRPPTLEYALALADGLPALHARWWGADQVAAAARPIHDAAHIQHFVDIAAPGVPHVLDHCETELTHWPDLIHQVLAQHPAAMLDRTRSSDGFTIIHGDPGCANILVPREGARPIYLIDRQPFDWSLTTWLSIYDLSRRSFSTGRSPTGEDSSAVAAALPRPTSGPRCHRVHLGPDVDRLRADDPDGCLHRRRVQPRWPEHQDRTRLQAVSTADADGLRRSELHRPLLNASLLRTTTGPNRPRGQRSPTPFDLNRRYADT